MFITNGVNARIGRRDGALLRVGGNPLRAYAEDGRTPKMGFNLPNGVFAKDGEVQAAISDILSVTRSGTNATYRGSDGDLATAAANTLRVTHVVPTPVAALSRYYGANGEVPVAVVDLRNNFFYWDGAEKAITDLTAVGAAYSLTSLSGVDFSSVTAVVEWDTNYNEVTTGTETIISFGKTTDGSIRANLNMANANNKTPYLSIDTPGTSYGTVAFNVPAIFQPIGRRRASYSLRDGQAIRMILDGQVEAVEGVRTYDGTASMFNTIGIGYRQIAGTQDQAFANPDSITLVIYAGMADAAIEATAVRSFESLPAVHILGDSISNENTYAAGGGVWTRVRNRLREHGYYGVSTSIAGGTNLEDFATRYAATPGYFGSNLIIWEGGLDTSGVDTLQGVTDILANFAGANYLFIEPIKGSTLTTGSANRIAHDAALSAIVDYIGTANYFETKDALAAYNDGSANDLTDIANDVIPRSLTTDGLHLNTAGQQAAAEIITAELTRRGWFPLKPGVLCEPTATTNLLLNTDALATQSATVTAVPHTLSFTGTGTVTLTGASTAGPLVGIGYGEGNRVTLTFTPSAGSLTCTVSGDVLFAQLEAKSSATSYVASAGTAAARAAENVYAPAANVPEWHGITDEISFKMAGLANYADTNQPFEAVWLRYFVDGPNRIYYNLAGTPGTGRLDFIQAAAGVSDSVSTDSSYYTPSPKMPFSIASRHSAGLIQGAVDGVALTANETVTDIADLSAAVIQLGHTGQPIIVHEFWVWPELLSAAGVASASAS